MKHGYTFPVIGVLVSDVESSYQVPLFDELCSQSAKLGIKLVVYSGTLFNQTFWFDRQLNIAYHLANQIHLDAILSVTSTFMRAGTESAVARLLNSFKPLPVASLTAEIPGIHSILIDNAGGFRQMLEHLINDHGYRDFAFLTGPAGSQDAQQRLKTFRMVMAEHDIRVDPRLIQDGEFYYFPARHAAERILSSGLPVRVIVAANDEMAMAAMGVAAEHGIRVPEDLAVVGVDDLHPHVSSLQLTTVNNSLERQVELALSSLLEQLDGRLLPPVTQVPVQVILRQSCGCQTEGHRTPSATDTASTTKEKLLLDLGLDKEKTSYFRDFLQRSMDALGSEDFSALERVVWEMARFCQNQSGGDISKPQALLLGIQTSLLDPANLSAQELWRQSSMLNKAQVSLTRAKTTFAVAHGERMGMTGGSLNILKRKLLSFEIHQQMEALPELLQSVGIQTCIIAFYDEQGYLNTINDFFLPTRARLVACVVNGIRHNDQLWRAFDTEALLPEPVWQLTGDSPLIVMPIFQQVGHYGYVLFGPERPIGLSLESVREAIASALIGAQLMEEIGHVRDYLNKDSRRVARTSQTIEQIGRHDSFSGLLNRRGFLESTQERIAKTSRGQHVLVQAKIQSLKEIERQFGQQEKHLLVEQSTLVFAGVLRASDLAARFHEDHFVALCSEVEACFPDELRSRLELAIEQFNHNSGKPYHLECRLSFKLIPENISGSDLTQLIDQLS